MNNINFNDLPCDIKKLIFKENRLTSIENRQKLRKIRLLNHINMVDECFNKFTDILKKDDDSEPSSLLDDEYCMEYLCDLEHERLEQRLYNEYYNLN